MKTIDLIISVLFSVLIIGLLFMATIPNQKKVECEVENQSPATVRKEYLYMR
jgi:competence protein ComGC